MLEGEVEGDGEDESVGVDGAGALTLEIGDGVGVASAPAVSPKPRLLNIKEATTTPILGRNADPRGLTLSSIRHKSLCTSGRSEIFRDLDSGPISCHTMRGRVCPKP